MSRGTQERQQKRLLIFEHGTITLYGAPFQELVLTRNFFTLLPPQFLQTGEGRCRLITPSINPCQLAQPGRLRALQPARLASLVAKIETEFGLIRFRSPLLTK